MQVSPCFAYSLCQETDGWRWSVYDQDGVTIAGGADASRAAAQAAVEQTLQRAEGAPAPEPAPEPADAPSPEAIRSTAQKNSLPVDKITEVRVLDPYFYR